jgi:hypothetical protein
VLAGALRLPFQVDVLAPPFAAPLLPVPPVVAPPFVPPPLDPPPFVPPPVDPPPFVPPPVEPPPVEPPPVGPPPQRDTVPPETAITDGPSGMSDSAAASFAFAADEPGATFECRVDAAAFAACAPPFTTAELPDGAHAFEVRARDPAGNADASPARRAFVSDTAVPDTRIDSGPGALTGDASPTFVFSSSEPGAAFQCRVDAAPFAACAMPFTTAVLADGAHSFDVRAVDAAGNADPSPAGRGFTSDTAAPDTTIDSGPAGRTTDLTPSFGFSSTEPGSSFECRVDAAAFAACSAPFTTRARGRHAFEVRATDAAGNHDPSPARRSFRSLLRIRSKIGHVWAYSSRFTTVVRLLVKGVPTGARVKVRCSGRGCPFGRRTIRPDRRRRARATALFGGARLLPGTVVEVRVTAPEAIGRVGRFRIRSGAVPRLRELCLQPGNRKPSRCTA